MTVKPRGLLPQLWLTGSGVQGPAFWLWNFSNSDNYFNIPAIPALLQRRQKSSHSNKQIIFLIQWKFRLAAGLKSDFRFPHLTCFVSRTMNANLDRLPSLTTVWSERPQVRWFSGNGSGSLFVPRVWSKVLRLAPAWAVCGTGTVAAADWPACSLRH